MQQTESSPPRTAVRALAFTIACALMLSGCGRFSRHRSAEELARSSAPPVDYQGGSLPPITRADPNADAPKGLLVVRVLDNLNRPLQGAYVRYKGPEQGRSATDSKGVIRVTLSPGHYVIDIAPCGATVVTKDYQAGDAVVVAGGNYQPGQLDGIRWERRFTPSPSVVYSAPPPWKIGARVRIGIRIEDGCDFGPAPGASIAGYSWKTSRHFGFSSRPVMRADANGYAQVDVVCRARGNGEVTIYDRANPSDSTNALLAGTGPPRGHTFCE